MHDLVLADTLEALERARPDRLSALAATVLAFSVLTDSGLEHYKAGFKKRAMIIAPLAAGATLMAGADAARTGRTHSAVFVSAAISGAIGTAFHLRNIFGKAGRMNWSNLFHAAPVGAPAALGVAGLLGLAAQRPPTAAWMAYATAVGLIASAAEAGLFHFRGAFHNKAMLAPVILPPLAGVALALAGLRNTSGARGRATGLLLATGALGLVGSAFHAHGIHRRSGGWKNYSQNLMQGPPMPAPLAFTGMALAGLAAVAALRLADR